MSKSIAKMKKILGIFLLFVFLIAVLSCARRSYFRKSETMEEAIIQPFIINKAGPPFAFKDKTYIPFTISLRFPLPKEPFSQIFSKPIFLLDDKGKIALRTKPDIGESDIPLGWREKDCLLIFLRCHSQYDEPKSMDLKGNEGSISSLPPEWREYKYRKFMISDKGNYLFYSARTSPLETKVYYTNLTKPHWELFSNLNFSSTLTEMEILSALERQRGFSLLIRKQGELAWLKKEDGIMGEEKIEINSGDKALDKAIAIEPSPDGELMAIVYRKGGKYFLSLINLQKETPEEKFEFPFSIDRIRWSSYKDYIVGRQAEIWTAVGKEKPSKLLIIDLKGRAVKNLPSPGRIKDAFLINGKLYLLVNEVEFLRVSFPKYENYERVFSLYQSSKR